MTQLLWWAAHVAGLDNPSGPWYALWSGIAGDVSQLALPVAVVMFYVRHNCEVRGCWRIGRHATDGGHRVCARHHPDGAPTHEDVLRRHRRAQDRAVPASVTYSQAPPPRIFYEPIQDERVP